MFASSTTENNAYKGRQKESMLAFDNATAMARHTISESRQDAKFHTQKPHGNLPEG